MNAVDPQTRPVAAADITIPPTEAEIAEAERALKVEALYRAKEQRPGVRLAGYDNDYRAPTLAEVIARQRRAKADDAAFWATPRGAFLNALKQVTGYEADVDAVRAAFFRGIICDPPILGEIANAVLALNRIPGSPARTAIDALAELLHEQHRRAA